MRGDVMQNTRTCIVCQQDKIEKAKVVGLLEPLPVLTRPWESVSMDFITPLSKVGDFEVILVIIDRFLKYGTFIPTTKWCSIELTTQLFLRHVIKLWGVPTSIVSDRDEARQNNWVQLLDVAQFCFNAQKSLSTERIPFKIVCGRQPVLLYLVDHPYVGKNPQAYNFTKEWKQTTNIA
ncbi:reverse transcriptase [Cucumis melo var. makuwa]|uniref:Reverse transcriptase n=1 Tax=Cucumis melo var. makuwa TaxID=1194695 RepID=A0A5A7VI60_CUCMM|nr:reverse transcriptase [Cucumis melo var. makuwa]